MRIIAGIAKGMLLAAPKGDAVRPTSDRVREAIFSSLGEHVLDATVLDLFAGTGALGLEAASRGARSVRLVEQARPALDCLMKNLAAFAKQRGEQPAIEIVRGEVGRELGRLTQAFDLIFADPPYGTDVQPVLETVQRRALLNANGSFVLETVKRAALVIPSGWHLKREACYGDTRISYLGLIVR